MKVAGFLLTLSVFFLYASSVRIESRPKLSDENLFHSHILKHDLDFSTAEEKSRRFQIFQNNLHFIRTFNRNGFSVGLNKFAHLSREEYETQFLQKPKTKKASKTKRLSQRRNVCPSQLPSSIDYRNRISPVQNEGDLGNSEVFAVVSSLEDGIQVRNGSAPPRLSQQNLIDCAGDTGLFQWIQENNGIDTETSYPTTGQPGPCKFNPETVGAQLPWYQDIISENETDLACAVAGVGPTFVCVDASKASFQFYSGGVYYEPSCSSSEVDHCMLTVGYGKIGTQQYWLVKNFWGASWGMGGYILMARNKGNNCGIATYATVPYAVPVV